jgi:hypothetical protein
MDSEPIAVDHILRGAEELKQGETSGGRKAGSQAFYAVLDEIRTLHERKSQDYGDDEDPLANIRNGADAIGIEPWKGCLLRIADKMQRMRSVCRSGRCEFDGIEDTLLDIAAYSAIALVVYREQAGHTPSRFDTAAE